VAAEICVGGKVKLTDIMRDMVNSLPEKAWLTKISVSRPLHKGSGQAATLDLSGCAAAADAVLEQDLAFQFHKRLSKTPALAQEFTDLKVTVQGETAGPNMDPDDLARRQVQRTTFLVTGVSKKR